MSRMLSLSFHAWALAKSATRPDVARAHLERIVAMADLPAVELARANRMLAGHLVRAGRYAAARRRLRAALQVDANDAESQLLLAKSWEDDPYGSDRKAARAYRRATEMNPNDAVAWASLARACVRCGRERIARKSLRRAVRLAPADPAVLAIAIEALRELGRLSEALKLAVRARFRAPKSTAIQSLVDNVHFEIARTESNSVGGGSGRTSVLPFVRIVGADGRQRTVRLDEPAGPMSIRLRRNG